MKRSQQRRLSDILERIEAAKDAESILYFRVSAEVVHQTLDQPLEELRLVCRSAVD